MGPNGVLITERHKHPAPEMPIPEVEIHVQSVSEALDVVSTLQPLSCSVRVPSEITYQLGL